MLLNEMEIFYYVVELNSFSQAADKLGVSKAFVSKHINQLEQDLQTRLLTRSTRKLTLTEAGKLFHQQCKKVLKEADMAYANIAELTNKPSGYLKVSVPPAFALNVLAPLIPEFCQQHPEITLELKLENELVDIIKEGYDLAIRSAKMQDSNLIAKRFMTIENVVVASPDYLDHNPKIVIPKDLERHNVATYSYAKHARELIFKHNRKSFPVSVAGNFLSNHTEMLKRMALANQCVTVLPRFMVEQELKDKKLTLCLDDYHLPSSEVYFIYPEREYMLPKVKLFMKACMEL